MASDRPGDARAGPGRAGRRLLIFGIQVLGYWLVVAAGLWLDLFGQDAWLDRYSQDVVNRVLAPAYGEVVGAIPGADTRAGEAPATVVLVNEETLAAMAEPGARRWPEPAFHHAMRLERILAYGPRAVFVDFIFADPFVGATASLERVIAKYDAAGVPLLFAGLPVTQRDPAPRARRVATMTQPDLPAPAAAGPVTPELARLVARLDGGRPAPPVELVSVALAPEDGIVRSYPLAGALQGGDTAKTAAVRLYEATTGLAVPPGEAIELLWRADPDGFNRQVFAGCAAKTGGLAARALSALLEPEALIRTCPASPTVPAIVLTVPRADDEVARRIAGRTVVYGGAIGAQDLFTTPTHARLPGAYVHAMAYDNLADLRGRYLRRAVTLPGGLTLDKTQAELFLAAPVLALLIAVYLSVFADMVERGGPLRVIAGGAVLTLATVLVTGALSALLLVAFRLAPLNWLGLLLLALPIWALARQRPVEGAWHRARAAWRWCRGHRAGAATSA